jgi:hypothetical protein
MSWPCVFPLVHRRPAVLEQRSAQFVDGDRVERATAASVMERIALLMEDDSDVAIAELQRLAKRERESMIRAVGVMSFGCLLQCLATPSIM